MLGISSTRGCLTFWGLGLVACIFIVSGPLQSHNETMKVHPIPKKRSISFQYDISSSLSEAASNLSSFPLTGRQKKLRRLPHIFSRVLELPFRSDADVSIQDMRDCFRFVITTDEVGEDVQAQMIEIYPGVTKIVIRGRDALGLSMDELELDLWRFRLPLSTRPELATAVYADGELVVTVPKGVVYEDSDSSGGEEKEEVWEEENGNHTGGFGHLVVVHFR